MHDPALARIERIASVHYRSIVPKHNITYPPVMVPCVIFARRICPDLVEQRFQRARAHHLVQPVDRVFFEEQRPPAGVTPIVMIGDGATDMEARDVEGGADAFIGFGGIQVREKVKAGADWFVTSFEPLRDAGLRTCWALSSDMCRSAVGGSLDAFLE